MRIDIYHHFEPETRDRELLDKILTRIERKVDHMAHTLDELRDNQVKLKALVEKLLALIGTLQPGTLTPAQQQELDEIVASQEQTLAEDPNP